MKVIIAGSRDIYPSVQKIQEYVDRSGFKITELINGKCPTGIDQRAEEWAINMGIPVIPFPPDWEEAERKYGNRNVAGPIRNQRMADCAEALIVIWDGISSGSASMKDLALEQGLPIFEVTVKKKRKRSN